MRTHTASIALTLCLAALLACHAEASSRADILINQLGFQPQGAKRAIVRTSAATGLPWQLIDAEGKVQARGETRLFGENAGSGDHVHLIDFSEHVGSGEGLRLVVAGMQSRPFAIRRGIYSDLKYDALAYFYHNRSGIPIEERFVKERSLARRAGHAPDIATCFNKRDSRGVKWPGCKYRLDATGGWYDAGDHGKYVVNAGITVWTLLNFYERAMQRSPAAASAFADGRLAIPERGNGVNDLLDEVRWELRFLLAMQVPDGHELAGMAHHKLHDESWTPLPMAPHQDKQRRYLYPPSVTATLNLAANAAQCARIWRTIDDAFSRRCLNAAERAFEAAERHPDLLPTGSFDGGGGYGDRDASDERYWAAAELFITTGEGKYEQVLRSSPHFLAAHAADGAGEIAWPSVRTLGTISLLTVGNSLAAADLAIARDNVLASADRYVQESAREGFHIPYSAEQYQWGSNSAILNRALILAVAHDLTAKRVYRDAVTDAMDYVLGRNPLDQSYVTGYGERTVRNPHHRFWAHSLDPAYPAPPPGVLSGGPNSSNMGDPVAREMKGKCRPQTCWRDDIRAYSQNEVAINWNAPLFWVAAWLDETEGAP